ncbi:hypothetical protein M9H77_05849 [Catharanthus roseus]|uniref:Uncharacterized protein n=1 Tax=Catharanthus roseus TaxID=4058 RepID=A0ACC0BQE2_CATRO|nr:hypothetical protein M9H77_05849 [Catharanthus roseus]
MKSESCSSEKQSAGGFVGGGIWKEGFHIITTTLLSLLLPLSFLLLARISAAHYLLAVPGGNAPLSSSTVVSFLFLYGNSVILYSLVSLVSVAALVYVVTGKRVNFFRHVSSSSSSSLDLIISLRSRLYTCWILLCALQVCVELGIEGSIAAGIDGCGFRKDNTSNFFLSKAIFFLGLHEVMRYWSTSIVKPVVDDTVLGYVKEEKLVERVAMAVSFGWLWWWRLRDEIDSLVVVAELKRELPEGVGLVDFIGWWLYYLTVLIGSFRILKGFIWVGMVMLFKKVEEEEEPSNNAQEIDEKV